ncbi:MAG: SDR family NAD(P)-dependent oxidoreductase [Chloroflexi bacterium]|nr:SDR family NAD(P)-dependent oxidoreductase [Chloroflexota bacterium]
MKDFRDKLAIVTGAGTGMGRELARQLASEGCHVAICDVLPQNMEETRNACEEIAPANTRITAHQCDVSDETQVLAFRDAVLQEHATDFVNLVFNNAGVGGGGSMLVDSREEWDRTFGICWSGVYYCTRAFLPLLVASTEGYIVNTSSVNGFWACLGPGIAHTAYSAAKFAVKGFTEALLTDLRVNAPHVKAAVVLPGYIGTSIAINSRLVHGKAIEDMSHEELEEARARLARQGMPVENLNDDQLRQAIKKRGEEFRDNAPVTAAQAATIILDGVRNEEWRILIGEDAHALDERVRANPEQAYDPSFVRQ